MRQRQNRKGQSTLEYAIIIVVVVAGLLAMQHYMRRGVEGKLRESSDKIGDQYAAGLTTSTYTTTQGTDLIARETFGQDFAGGDDNGYSRYQVSNAPITTRQATGADAETISTDFASDTLF